MRAVSFLALALLAPMLVQEDEAERACLGMEKRFLEARTLRFSFAMTVEVDTHEDKLKGTIWLGEGNKARIDVKGTMSGGKPLEMFMVSDGNQMVTKMTGVATQAPRETPRGTGELIRGTIARAGVFAGLFYGTNDKKEPTLDDLFQLSEYKVGNREKKGVREILVIEEKIKFRGAKEQGMITVWIDSKSFLCDKRVFTINDASHKVRVMEAYEGMAVDGKLDDELFVLPK
jgi:outer membrane lipoprotein-sorting protein